jgi:hypothetical protein
MKAVGEKESVFILSQVWARHLSWNVAAGEWLLCDKIVMLGATVKKKKSSISVVWNFSYLYIFLLNYKLPFCSTCNWSDEVSTQSQFRVIEDIFRKK